jgi:putative membrane protein insertion efficiency factor
VTPEAPEARPWPLALLSSVLVFLVRGYQLVLSPVLHLGGARCRFHPTCSAYAIAVIQKDGPFRGTVRALGRILRCHPLHPGGFDPP